MICVRNRRRLITAIQRGRPPVAAVAVVLPTAIAVVAAEADRQQAVVNHAVPRQPKAINIKVCPQLHRLATATIPVAIYCQLVNGHDACTQPVRTPPSHRPPTISSTKCLTKCCSPFSHICSNRTCVGCRWCANALIPFPMTQNCGNDCTRAFTSTICHCSIRNRANFTLSKRKTQSTAIRGRKAFASCTVAFTFDLATKIASTRDVILPILIRFRRLLITMIGHRPIAQQPTTR